MNTILISTILLTIAILAAGVIYGADMFYAIVNRKATALSKDSSVADLIGIPILKPINACLFLALSVWFVPHCLPSSTL